MAGKEAKKKTPQFNEVELTRLIQLYVENRDRYHGQFQAGGKTGPSERRTLLTQWTTELSNLGYAARTREQIEEKIKNEVKKVQKYLRLEKEKHTGTGGGAGPSLPKLPSYLNPLVNALAEKHLEQGIPGIDEAELGDEGMSMGPGKENVGQVFEEEPLVEQKPTRKQMAALLERPIKSPSSSPEVVKERTPSVAKERSRSIAAVSRETLSVFTDKRSQLWEEETKLALLRQKKVEAETELIRHQIEETKLSIELRKVELDRARAELERSRTVYPSTYFGC